MHKPALNNVSDVYVHDSGAAVSLFLANDAGQRFDMSLPVEELTRFIENLIDLGITAAKTRTDSKPVALETSPPSEFSCNEITGVAIGESSDRQSLTMLLRLFVLDLTFTTGRSIVCSLADSFSKMAAELRAEESADD